MASESSQNVGHDEPRSRARGAAGMRAWRRERWQAPRSRRWFPLVLTGLAYLGFSALLFWVILWLWPPQPACVALVGAGYETNLAIPHNLAGKEGIKELAAVTRLRPFSILWRSRHLRLLNDPRTLRTHGSWDKGIDRFSESTFVLYMAVHGGADEHGAYLLANDADTRDDPRSRLRVEAVLDRLAKLPASKNKVLILDATQVASWWPLGMLRNDFARALDDLNDKIAKVPNLVVLSASAPDQRSWVSPEWRQTVFSHFLSEGLRGEAADDEGRIDAAGLFHYVDRHVQAWAAANRQARQTPVLLPHAKGEVLAGRMELAAGQKRSDAVTPELPITSEPTGLNEAWSTFDRLRLQIPSPAVYTPHIWTRYQAALLRYEALLRGGDRASAKTMQGVLSALEREIRETRTLRLGSVQNTLAMPALEGSRLPSPTTALRLQFNDLWAAPPDEYATRWAAMQQGPGSGDPRQLRLQLYEFMLRNASDGAFENIERVARLAPIVDDPDHPRPAEIHDIVMLHRDLAAQRPSNAREVLKKAIAVRKLAEETALAAGGKEYSYSERVAPWIQPALRQGDQERRLGQDLLFASDDQSWAAALGHLEQAERLYHQAEAFGDTFRAALTLRDDLLPILPYYTQWVASGDDSEEPSAAGYSANAKRLETIWTEIHDLFDALDQVKDPAEMEALIPRMQAIRKDFDTLQTHIAETRDRLLKAEPTPGAWRAIEALLSVPFDLPREPQREAQPLRARLQSRQKQIGRTLALESLKGNGTDPKLREAPDLGTIGRLALASVGRGGFDPGPEEAAQLSRSDLPSTYDASLKLFVPGQAVGPENALLHVEERIASTMHRRVVALVEGAIRLGPTAKLDVLRKTLMHADRLARMIDVTIVERWDRELKKGPRTRQSRQPLRSYRALLVADLLAIQTERALEDHWYAEKPNGTPYYQRVGSAYLDDMSVLDSLRLHADVERKLNAALQRKDGLTIAGLQRRDRRPDQPEIEFTSELAIDVAYDVRGEAEGTPRRGAPVFWFEPGEYLEQASRPRSDRVVRQVGADQANARLDSRWVSLLKPSDGSKGRPSQIVVHGRFRGQVLKRETSVMLYPLAETIASHHPLPEMSGVAVRADEGIFKRFGEANGALAIVLDCSGSMGAPEGTAFGPATKYAQATDALEKLLSEMPPGIVVSLWVFGASVPGQPSIAAEKTIQRVQGPAPWIPALLPNWMSSVRYPRLEPWNYSPIIRSMWQAKADLEDAQGFKTLLVITDGADDRYAYDAQLAKGRDIASFLRDEFGESGISVNVVNVIGSLTGITDTTRAQRAQEAARARSQFEVIQSFAVPGRYYTVETSEALIERLREAMKQHLTYRLLGEDNRFVFGASSHEVSISHIGATDQWFPVALEPGGYKVQALARKSLTKDILLRGGDLMLVTLVERPDGRVAFERSLYAEEYAPWSKDFRLNATGQWRLSALQNQRLQDGSAQLLVALEKKYVPTETTLELVRPREVWIELDPGSGDHTGLSVHSSNRERYAAPAWSIDAIGWPTTPGKNVPAAPTLRAWWDPTDVPSLPLFPLVRGQNFLLDPPRDELRPFQINGGEVILESVRFERHLVEISAADKTQKLCLVVRLSYPPGRPVYVRPRGIELAGWEHRLYKMADKYTGIFWTQTDDEVKTALTHLDLVLLDDFKAICEASKHAIEVPLPPPHPESTRPPDFATVR